jgi:hypothetical protein
VEVVLGEGATTQLTLPSSATPQDVLARLAVGQEEASLKILCSEEFLVEDCPLLHYQTLRDPHSPPL